MIFCNCTARSDINLVSLIILSFFHALPGGGTGKEWLFHKDSISGIPECEYWSIISRESTFLITCPFEISCFYIWWRIIEVSSNFEEVESLEEWNEFTLNRMTVYFKVHPFLEFVGVKLIHCTGTPLARSVFIVHPH